MNRSNLKSALIAGLIYFSVIFIFAFILGVIRTIVLIPRIGPLAAVMIEIPILLTVSWFFCRMLIRRIRLTGEIKYFLIFGGSAFIWLMLTEYFLSINVFNQPQSVYFGKMMTLHGFLGLLAQIAFASIPVIQRNKQ